MSYCGCHKPDCLECRACAPHMYDDSVPPRGLLASIPANQPRRIKLYHNNGQPLRNPMPKKPAHVSARQWKKAIKAARRQRKET